MLSLIHLWEFHQLEFAPKKEYVPNIHENNVLEDKNYNTNKTHDGPKIVFSQLHYCSVENGCAD